MRIFVATFDDDPHTSPNPYVCTLIDNIADNHRDVVFCTKKSTFWSDDIFSYDLVHVMWPDAFLHDGCHTIEQLSNRLTEVSRRVTIICTCHNLHSSQDPKESVAYDVVYREADFFIHMGDYSKRILLQKYPKSKHIVIPHHIFDTVYVDLPSRDEALHRLKLKARTYAIAFGAFRTQAEKDLFLYAADCFRPFGVYCIAPNFINAPHGRINKRWVKKRIKMALTKLLHPNIVYLKDIHGSYVSHDLLPYLFACSEISFIQRTDILNSGNVPLGMYFGNVIVGPDIGNVGELLRKMNNPVFCPEDRESVFQACQSAVECVKQEVGERNKSYACHHWNTATISEMLYDAYKLKVLSKR